MLKDECEHYDYKYTSKYSSSITNYNEKGVTKIKNNYYVYRVCRNGAKMLATVATNNKITCKTVNRTLISLSTSARAFELSNESRLTNCCKCWCC